ncbi:MAG: cellulase family glycosylhydrolase [Candidatus Marinimicrobia bacterium]|nr:cellulase family glycosylhydrolase [Candidatus Neomarinimicrobiota bacterium]
MRKLNLGIISLIFLVFTLSCSQPKAPKYKRLMKPEGKEFYHVPIGLCEDYPEETTTSEIIKGDMELLKDTGVDLLRISFGWDAIEADKDNYDWLFWDEYVNTAVDEYGITLIPYICYTPRWNSRGDSLMFWNDPPLDFDEFGEFMFDLVTRYKDKIKTWELWNEPDLDIYWDTGDIAAFAEFTKIGAEAVRRADPEAKVVLGGLAYHPEFLEELFKDHGLSPYIDIVNIHNYYETWSERPVEDIVKNINGMHEIIEKYGNDQSLWMAEVGYSTFRQGTYVSSSYSAYYDYEHTPEYQAVDLVKRIALALSTEKLSALTWYEIKDLPKSEEVIGDNNNNRFLGIVYPDYKPKPTKQALTFFRQLFSQPYKNIDPRLEVQKPEDSDAQVHAFEMENGEVVVLSWLATCVPEKRPKNPEELVPDERSEEIDIEINGIEANNVELFDELGNKKTWKNVSLTDNNTQLDQVSMSGGNIYIFRIKQ